MARYRPKKYWRARSGHYYRRRYTSSKGYPRFRSRRAWYRKRTWNNRFTKTFVPSRLRVKLSWRTDWTARGSTLSLQHLVFRGNGAYDPDNSTGGKYPYGFYQLQQLYKHYLCFASKFAAYFYTTTASATLERVDVVIAPTTFSGNPSYTEIKDLKEVPYSKSLVFDKEKGNKKTHKLSSYSSNKRMFPSASQRDVTFCSQTTNVPQSQWYWHLWSLCAAEYPFQYCVHIVYYIEFYTRWSVNDEDNIDIIDPDPVPPDAVPDT